MVTANEDIAEAAHQALLQQGRYVKQEWEVSYAWVEDTIKYLEAGGGPYTGPEIFLAQWLKERRE